MLLETLFASFTKEFPPQRASYAELSFTGSLENAVEWPLTWDPVTLMWRHYALAWSCENPGGSPLVTPSGASHAHPRPTIPKDSALSRITHAYTASVNNMTTLDPGGYPRESSQHGSNWQQVNIGSGNGLAPAGAKPLPEPMVTQFSDAIWRH